MKHLIKLMIVLFLITGCTNPVDHNKSDKLIPDIGDLSMTENLQQIFSERRKNLMEQIKDGIVILRSDCAFDGGRHEFRAANNFYYLTGFTEPDAVVMLTKDGIHSYILYVKDRTIRESIYVGEIPETDEIMKTYQPDTVRLYKGIGDVVKAVVQTGDPVYFDFDDAILKENINRAIGNKIISMKLVKDIAPLINEMRVHKNNNEIARLQKAIDITGEAFIDASRICNPGMYEFEIEAMVEYTFRKFGSPMPAFTSIIASGPNATVLHYAANTRKMEDGDLLLFDIGAEYGYYSADVSRTVPVNGKFTKEQKDIYELVLKAQKAAISEMLPGNYLVANQIKSNEIIIQGLYELGLITNPESNWQRKFYILYPINHYLGMYVHDVGDYGAPDGIFYENITSDTIYGRTLDKGMVLTVEPGLYFRSNGLDQLIELFGEEVPPEEIKEFVNQVLPVYEKYKNIGVRIEDDVLITDEGNVVLSGNIPKEVDDIERMMRKR